VLAIDDLAAGKPARTHGAPVCDWGRALIEQYCASFPARWPKRIVLDGRRHFSTRVHGSPTITALFQRLLHDDYGFQPIRRV